MYRIAKPLYLHCQTPLHAGSGSDLGIVDLPIQRERHTSFPKIEGSSLKGSIRERFEQQFTKGSNQPDIIRLFGPDSEGDDQNTHAGALGFTDARLLLFPVKSMRGVFAWITCPRVLNQMLQDMERCGITNIPQITESPEQGQAMVIEENSLKIPSAKENIILEEFLFQTAVNGELATFAGWLTKQLASGSDNHITNKLTKDIVILHNDDFKDFVNLSTEVITRTKINNHTGTVQDGALFTEEYLPSESILYSLVLAAPVFPVHKEGDKDEKGNKLDPFTLENGKGSEATHVMDRFNEILLNNCQHRLQIGGNATLGKGLIQTSFNHN